MRARKIESGLRVLALGVISIMCAHVACAQRAATRSSGAASSGAADSGVSATSSAGSPAQAGLQGTASQWNAGSGRFGHNGANAWSIRNESTTNSEMWSPGKANFGLSPGERGVWKAQPPSSSGAETPTAAESGSATASGFGAVPGEIHQTSIGLPVPVVSSASSRWAPSSARSIKRVAVQGAQARGDLSTAHLHGGSRHTSTAVHHAARASRGTTFRIGSPLAAARQTQNGIRSPQQSNSEGLSTQGFGHLGLSEPAHSPQKRTGSGLDQGHLGGHSE